MDLKKKHVKTVVKVLKLKLLIAVARPAVPLLFESRRS